MALHQSDDNMRNDNEFISGTYKFLSEGNKCRLLDGRRTEGYIGAVEPETGMYRWHITKYEDTGKYWDMPFGSITSFQFEVESQQISDTLAEHYEIIESTFDKVLSIPRDAQMLDMHQPIINQAKTEALNFFHSMSEYFSSNEKLDFDKQIGSVALARDLEKFLELSGVLALEKRTQMLMVLNPDSGEWIKGLKITAAKMGLCAYDGKISRTKDIFEGMGSIENRTRYLSYRLGFIQAYFEMLGMNEVVVYRGMSTQNDWMSRKRSFLHCTFNYEVAAAFSDFKRNSDYRHAYILKATVPVEKLFMTYLETDAMNRQYKEAEAILFYEDDFFI